MRVWGLGGQRKKGFETFVKQSSVAVAQGDEEKASETQQENYMVFVKTFQTDYRSGISRKITLRWVHL